MSDGQSWAAEVQKQAETFQPHSNYTPEKRRAKALCVLADQARRLTVQLETLIDEIQHELSE